MHNKGKKVGFSNHDERSVEPWIKKLKKSKVSINKRISTTKKTKATIVGVKTCTKLNTKLSFYGGNFVHASMHVNFIHTLLVIWVYVLNEIVI
jgi:hypothetical protein